MSQIIAALFQLAIVLAGIAAWLTHIIECIKDDRIALLIVGALLFPVGIIHGVGVWFGVL